MGRTSDARERILQSAVELFTARGYGDVGVKEICDHSGVKKGSFYHFFPSKRDLVLAMIEDRAEFYRQIFEKAMGSSAPPLDRIQRAFDLLYQAHLSDRETSGAVKGCSMGNLAIELSTHDDTVRRRLAQVFKEWTGYFEHALGEALDAGDVQGIDPAASAESLVAYLEGLALLAKTHNDPGLFRRRAPDFARLACRAEERN